MYVHLYVPFRKYMYTFKALGGSSSCRMKSESYFYNIKAAGDHFCLLYLTIYTYCTYIHNVVYTCVREVFGEATLNVAVCAYTQLYHMSQRMSLYYIFFI